MTAIAVLVDLLFLYQSKEEGRIARRRAAMHEE